MSIYFVDRHSFMDIMRTPNTSVWASPTFSPNEYNFPVYIPSYYFNNPIGYTFINKGRVLIHVDHCSIHISNKTMFLPK